MKHAKKHVKRFASLLLALVMVLSMSMTAFAAETSGDEGGDAPTPVNMEGPDSYGTEKNNQGKITVKEAFPGEQYTIYQIAYLESYDAANARYVYKLNSKWEGLMEWKKTENGVEKDVIKGVYLRYVDTTNKYIAWAVETTTDSIKAQFAKLCMEYAKTNNIPPVMSQTAPAATGKVEDPDTGKQIDATTSTLEFSNLKLGYYLMDSSVGFLCSLNTAAKEVEIEEKNIIPTVTKQVKEDSSESFGPDNDADIGQDVEFRSDIKIRNTSNVIFHDTMSAGLDFVYDASKEWDNAPMEGLEAGKVPAGKQDYLRVLMYNETDGTSLATTLIENQHYAVTKGALKDVDKTEDKCTFHITFTDAVYNMMANKDAIWHIVVYYTGRLNQKAVIAGEGNPNECHVTYGDLNTVSEKPSTVTKTYELKVFKFSGAKEGLDDTAFTLKLASTGEAAEIAEGQEIQFILISDGKSTTGGIDTEAVYRVATPEEIADGSVKKITEIVTNKSGKFVIRGLDASTYLLTETRAHEGFNKLDEPERIIIGKNGTVTGATNGYYEIENNSGAVLPSTGGIGTTIFYVLGSILLVGAAILLITKRRMSAEK